MAFSFSLVFPMGLPPKSVHSLPLGKIPSRSFLFSCFYTATKTEIPSVFLIEKLFSLLGEKLIKKRLALARQFVLADEQGGILVIEDMVIGGNRP